MLSRQNAVLEALLSARRFITDSEASLTSVDLTGVRKRLDDLVTSFTTHAYDQDAHNRSAMGETEKQHKLRLKLRSRLMAPIAEIARQSLQAVPEFKALQMPPRSAKGQAFLASAKAMVDAALKYKDALIERGLPASALDQFQTLLTTFESSVGDRKQNRDQRKGATKGLTVQEKEGRSVLKVLDALVREALDGNEALLATWDGARRIYYRSGGARAGAGAGAANTNAPGTPPATTPAAVATTPATPIEAPASSTPATPILSIA